MSVETNRKLIDDKDIELIVSLIGTYKYNCSSEIYKNYEKLVWKDFILLFKKSFNIDMY